MNIVICTIKSWNIENAGIFRKSYKDIYNIKIITEKNDLSIELLNILKPNYVFFPHWSYIIPEDIFF